MNLVALLGLMVRFWRVTVIVVSVTVVLAYVAATSTTDEFEITGALLMEPSFPSTEGELTAALVEAARSPEVRVAVDGPYRVEQLGSQVRLEAEAESSEDALAIVEEASAALEDVFPTVLADYGTGDVDAELVQLAAPGIVATRLDRSTAEAIYRMNLARSPPNPYREPEFARQVLLDVAVPEVPQLTRQLGPRTSLAYGVDEDSWLPFIEVVVVAPTRASAERGFEAGEAHLRSTLDALQDQIQAPEAGRTGLAVLARSKTIATVPATPMRPVFAILLGGFIALVLSVLAARSLSEADSASLEMVDSGAA